MTAEKIPRKRAVSPLVFGAIVVGAIVVACVLLSVTGLGLPFVRMIGGPLAEGYAGRIVTTEGEKTIAARSAADFALIGKVSVDTLAQMQAADRVFLIADGTRVRVLSVEPPCTHVTILAGEHAGEDVWVATAFVGR